MKVILLIFIGRELIEIMSASNTEARLVRLATLHRHSMPVQRVRTVVTALVGFVILNVHYSIIIFGLIVFHDLTEKTGEEIKKIVWKVFGSRFEMFCKRVIVFYSILIFQL